MAQLTDLIQQQTVAIEQLNDSMSGISSVMDGQLQSLKSIARWQDQTALYTSHLQNIKVDLNQIRKWGENINHIADRIDVLANQEDAERQDDLSGGDDDAVSLSGALLEQIADNTLRTAIAVEQMASVQAEPFEDKRTKTDAKPISRREQKSKAEQGEIGKAMGTAGTFLGEVFRGFLALGALVGSVLLAPTSFFETVREFFGKVKGLFTQLMGFFVNDVAPVISFLFEELLTFFNRLAPELSELGVAVGDALRKVGPQIWATISPVLAFIADGIIKGVDLLTDALENLPAIVEGFGTFISDLVELFFDPDNEYDTHLEAIQNFFSGIGDFFNDLIRGDFMTTFKGTLYLFWNSMIELLNIVLGGIVDAYNMFARLKGEDEINPDDYYIDRKFDVTNTDMSAELVDKVMEFIARGDSPEVAIEKATSDKTLMQLIEGTKESGYQIDHRIPMGITYKPSNTLDAGGEKYLLAEGEHALRTRQELMKLFGAEGMAGLENLYAQRHSRLAHYSLGEGDPGAYSKMNNVKYKKITGIHDALPRYSDQYGLPDVMIVTADPGNKLYDHYYTEDGERKELPDEFIRANLTHLINQMGAGGGGGADKKTTPTSTIVLQKNTFGTGTGASVSRSSVDNRFVLDPSVHGSKPVVISPTMVGGSSSSVISSTQVSHHSSGLSRNPFYTK